MAEATSTSHRLRDELVSRAVNREERWHYEGGKRDLRLDLLRGFAAAVMIADHIGEESWLYAITGGNRFFVSAAEAFVFISGAVMGIVYLNVFTRQGMATAVMKAFHRAWTLYVVTVLLTLSFAALAYALDLGWTPDISDGGLGRYVLDVATLHRTLYLTDVLLMYVLLLLGACPVIFLISQGRTDVVLVASWLIWLLWQISPESASLPWAIEGNTVFYPAAWQVLFVTGIAVGWHRSKLETWVRKIPAHLLAGALAVVVAVVVVLYLAQLLYLDSLQENSTLYTLAFDKPDLPVGRLVVFLLLATFAFTLTTLLWEPVRRVTGWLLLPLGQNALTAYSLHIFLVAAAVKFTELAFAGNPGQGVYAALQLSGVLLVWLVVRYEPLLRDAVVQKLSAFYPPMKARFAEVN